MTSRGEESPSPGFSKPTSADWNSRTNFPKNKDSARFVCNYYPFVFISWCLSSLADWDLIIFECVYISLCRHVCFKTLLVFYT